MPTDDNTQQEPAAPEQAEQDAQPVDVTPDGKPVEDPAAYWQSQAQKYERLLARAQEQEKQAGEALKALEVEKAKEWQDQLEALRAEAETAKTEAEKNAVEAMRVKAMAGAGLDPELAEFVTASDAEGIQAQVAKLAERLGAQRAPGGTGGTRTGNPAGGSSLTIETIRQMSPEQIMARKDEVDRVLAEQGRK